MENNERLKELEKAVAVILKYIEDNGTYELEDTKAHNGLKSYFNKYKLWNVVRDIK